MKARNTTALTLLLYLILMIMPSFFLKFLPAKNGYFLVMTLWYLLGMLLLLWLNTKIAPNNVIENANPFTTKPKVIIWGLIGGVLAIFLQLGASTLERLLFHIPTASQNTATLLATMTTYPYYVISVLLFLPIIEELVYRKTIFGRLVPFTGKIGAAIISSLVFAFAHQDGHILLYSTIGLFFCFLYNYTGRIWTTMLAHMLMNSLVFIFSVQSWH
ncbi:lysostaphin resistance A-like protein [Agrilactobacillus fermenti]|uniref:CPBP family intramembrane glutamic endopeptidase n=1 Tax=Agrilactobacillus fermenti TaxID=2586909 RepID=UPI001E33D5BE|nr:CPBP family intramembrane glutamic endopeptidase [Agrilactobacillus fermenti]MCD2256750.1 CPBP family intramembrane metalloprotease [Agrilactobacillus fermenti]